MIISQELEILLIFYPIINLKSEWQKVKNFLVGVSVIIGHSVEKSLLVAYNIVVDEVVLHSHLPNLLRANAASIFQVFTP